MPTPLALSRPDQLEQPARLRVGERGGRLVEDEQAHVREQRLGDLHHLLMRARKVADLPLWLQIEAESDDDPASLLPHRLRSRTPKALFSCPRNRFCSTVRLRHQAEFLEHRADADQPRRGAV